jgi:hypothetical protein
VEAVREAVINQSTIRCNFIDDVRQDWTRI